MNRIKNITVISILIGTILEWYDFSLLGSLSPVIASKFFPSSSSTLSLLGAFSVFATGFIARPLGGVLFGHIGDRRGRKNALSLTIILMTIPTTLIGLLPDYHAMGIFAPILLILLRLLQGFASSGEYPGAICLLTEIAPSDKRGFYGSLSMLGVVSGIFLGSSIMLWLSTLFTQIEIYAWGWRIPFLISTPLGVIGCFLRYKTNESEVFKSASLITKKSPLKELIDNHSRNLIIIIMAFALSTVTFYLGFVYIVGYLISLKLISLHDGYISTAISSASLALLIPLFGFISDYVNKKTLMYIGTICLLIGVYPIFILFSESNFATLLIGQLSLALLIAIFVGALPALTSDSFTTSTRYTGISMGLNIGATVFGGTCPMIAMFLVNRSGSPVIPCIIPITFAAFCLLLINKISTTFP